MIKVRKRAKVLSYSLILENIASNAVAYLLNVASPKDSLSFGNKSSSLSFNQKLNLLIDNDSITKKEKSTLEHFSNVRNQFMHNIHVNNYVDAFEAIDGLTNKMRKLYPHNFDSSLERSLEKCVEDLYKDGREILVSFKGGLKKKLEIEGDAKTYKDFFIKLDKSVKKNLKELEDAIKEIDNDSIKKELLLDVLTLMKIEILSSPVIDLMFKEEK